MNRSALALACVVSACSPAKPPPKPALPPLDTRSLAGVTQGPGARWVVMLRPATLFGGELGPALGRLLPKEGVDRLTAKLGFEVRKVPEALLVGFAATTFWAVRLPEGASPSTAIDGWERRLLPPTGRRSPRPDVVQVSGALPTGGQGGAAGMWSAHGDLLVTESGRLGPVQVSLVLADGRLSRARSLEKVSPFDALAAWAKDAPVAVLARCPLDELLQSADPKGSGEGGAASPGAQGAPVVAQECDGAALSLRPQSTKEGKGVVVLDLHVPGRWGKDASPAGDDLRKVVERVMASDLGHALGLRDAGPVTVEVSPTSVDARLRVDGAKLAEGLRKLVSAEITDATK